KCTMCYDRLKLGEQPACSKTCPTESIQFGTYENMLAAAQERVAELHRQGQTEARLYGANNEDGVGGTGSIFFAAGLSRGLRPSTRSACPDRRFARDGEDFCQGCRRDGRCRGSVVFSW